MRFTTFISALVLLSFGARAQTPTAQSELGEQVNLVFGLGQIAQGGFNVEGNYARERLIFDYSHGINLSTSNDQLEDGDDKANGLAVHIPWTTGFGVGWRFTRWLNVRAEPKWHRFELYRDGDLDARDNRLGAYTTFTLGLGVYANLRPFGRRDDWLRGFMVVPNVRWWPNVSTSLTDDQLTYANGEGSEATHDARSIGIGNTPFFANVSVGYSLELK